MKTCFVLGGGVALAAAVFARVERPAAVAQLLPEANTSGPRHGLPVAFVPNLGQWDEGVSFLARAGGMAMFLGRTGFTFTLADRPPHDHTHRFASPASEPADSGSGGLGLGVAVHMAFVGAQPVGPIAEQRLPGCHHYYLGNDPSRWRTDVPLFGAVLHRGVWPGVDVRMRTVDRRFEYDLLLAPGAALEPVEIEVDGIEAMHLDADGALVLETALGPVRMAAPCTWEVEPGGGMVPVACKYELHGPRRFGFEAAVRREGCALVIDPGIEWSTLLGGTADDNPNDVALAPDGSPVLGGLTMSSDFPTTTGPYLQANSEAFVTRLAPDGRSLVYSIVIGGSGFDYVLGLCLDGQGGPVVCGQTQSPNFPVTSGVFGPVYHPTGIIGAGDCFVARFTPGGTLVYSSYLGGNNFDFAEDIALAPDGSAVVVGETWSLDFPITLNALIWINQGFGDAFVVQVAPDGSTLLFGTFLGGPDRDQAQAGAVDLAGTITVTGNTSSSLFPTTPFAFDRTYNGGGYNGWGDVFVTQIIPSAPIMVFSTFLGAGGIELAKAVAVDATGQVTVVGDTNSPTFPTTAGSFDPTYNGGSGRAGDSGDAYVTRLAADGGSLVFSTFLGGAADDAITAVAVGPRGDTTIAGWTMSAGFPTTPGAHSASYAGSTDAFVARLSPAGSRLEYSTFLGGAGGDGAIALALDARGGVTIVGSTDSATYPTTAGVFQPVLAGASDGVVTRLDMLPVGVSAFGASTPGCNGPLAIGVNSMPRVGNLVFAIHCGNAAPSALGLIAVASARRPGPLPLLGVGAWIDPARLLATATVGSDLRGACEVPLPVGNNPALAGLRLFAQFLWLGPNAPVPCPALGFSASHAIDLTVQP